ncbi:MAG: hypothetical protein ACYTEQ_31115 [Planctomycetota bacterium]|jgi:hypothetical protein
MLVEYDYDAQEWATGKRALDLRHKHLLQEQELISGPDGKSYLLSVGACETVTEALTQIRACLRDLYETSIDQL